MIFSSTWAVMKFANQRVNALVGECDADNVALEY